MRLRFRLRVTLILLACASHLHAEPSKTDPVSAFKAISLDHLTAFCFWANNQIYMRRKSGEIVQDEVLQAKEVDSDANYFIALHNRHVLNTAETRRIHREAQELLKAQLDEDLRLGGLEFVHVNLRQYHIGCSLDRVEIQMGAHVFSQEAKNLRR